MYWICKRCGATMTTNSPSAKPTGGNCKKRAEWENGASFMGTEEMSL